MKLTPFTLILALVLIPTFLKAQVVDSSLIYVEPEAPLYVQETFRTFRLVYGHSVETLWKNNLMFAVSHRFGGTINEGIDELFGLDGAANIRLVLAYGITDNLTIGLGRSRTDKLYDGYVKYRILRQKTYGWPLTITALASAAIRTQPFREDIQQNLEFKHKMKYFSQLMIGSRIGFFSFQVNPAYSYQTLTQEIGEPNGIFALGGGVRFQVTEALAFTAEYTHPFISDFETENPRRDVVGFGFDISTARHSFQLQVSNTTGLVGQAYIPNTTGDFFKGDIHIGFHISRKFAL